MLLKQSHIDVRPTSLGYLLINGIYQNIRTTPTLFPTSPPARAPSSPYVIDTTNLPEATYVQTEAPTPINHPPAAVLISTSAVVTPALSD